MIQVPVSHPQASCTCGCDAHLTSQDIPGISMPSLSADCWCPQGYLGPEVGGWIQSPWSSACCGPLATNQLCTWKRQLQSLVHPPLKDIEEQTASLRVKSPLDVPLLLLLREGVSYVLHSHTVIKQII